jgi:hypothetical protein
MGKEWAEKLLRQLAEAVADILPTLEAEMIQPETKAALSKLLYAIGKFVEKGDEQAVLADGMRRLNATALGEAD